MSKTEATTTTTDKALLAKCEAIIRRGQAAFLESAKAVLDIIKDKLYEPQFKTAKDYFANRWDMNDSEVSRYKKAGVLIDRLKRAGFTDSQLPKNEGQCRALADVVGDDKQVSVWRQIVDSGKKPTAALIATAANPSKPQMSDDPDAAFADVVAATGANMDVPRDPPKPKCSAFLEVELDSSVLADALDYNGIACNQVRPGVWGFAVTGRTREELFVEISSWATVYNVKRMSIVFE